MDTPKIFESEYRFCLILWEHEPIRSGALVELAKERLGWKPTTTYTVLPKGECWRTAAASCARSSRASRYSRRR